MRILVSDAWAPQVNGVVRTLQQVKSECEALGHRVEVISPDLFRTVPCPTYPEIRLALRAGRAIGERIDAVRPDRVHIATEGPLGLAARRQCLRRGLPFTTSYHTRFPSTCTPVSRCRSRSPTRGCVGFIASAAVMVATGASAAIWKRAASTTSRTGAAASTPSCSGPIWSRRCTCRAPFTCTSAGWPWRRIWRRSWRCRSARAASWWSGRPTARPASGEVSRCPLRRRQVRRGPRPPLRQRRRVRLPEPHRHLRAGAARGARLGSAGRSLSGAEARWT